MNTGIWRRGNSSMGRSYKVTGTKREDGIEVQRWEFLGGRRRMKRRENVGISTFWVSYNWGWRCSWARHFRLSRSPLSLSLNSLSKLGKDEDGWWEWETQRRIDERRGRTGSPTIRRGCGCGPGLLHWCPWVGPWLSPLKLVWVLFLRLLRSPPNPSTSSSLVPPSLP